MKKLFTPFLLFMFLCFQLSAAAGPDQKHIDKVKRKVAECIEHSRRVTIETYDGRLLQGSIKEAGADTFVLVTTGGITTLKYSDVKNIKWPSPHMKTGIVVAVVLGGLLGLAILIGRGLRE